MKFLNNISFNSDKQRAYSIIAVKICELKFSQT